MSAASGTSSSVACLPKKPSDAASTTTDATQAVAADAGTMPSEGAAAAENAERPEDTAATETYAPSLEQCFTVPGHLDMSIFSDRHMYIRTRGNNHYLVTTELCEGLERSRGGAAVTGLDAGEVRGVDPSSPGHDHLGELPLPATGPDSPAEARIRGHLCHGSLPIMTSIPSTGAAWRLHLSKWI